MCLTPRGIGAVAAVVVLGLAGCASDPGEADETAGASTTTTAPAAIVTDVTVTSAPVETPPADTIAANAGEGKDIVTRSPDAVGDGDPPTDVGTAVVRITDADGETCDVCMWLADESAERSTGLMGVRDLGGAVGMAFAWDTPTTGNFFMFNTPMPLSIAWFDPDGRYLSQTDMAPCLVENSAECERYGTTGAYTLAIEMYAGQLDAVGIGPGSSVEIVRTIEPGADDLCPLAP